MCLLTAALLLIILYIILATFLSPLPVNDIGSVRYHTIPWMTVALIVVNSVLFLTLLAPHVYEQRVGMRNAAIQAYVNEVWTYGFRESVVRNGTGFGAWTTFTSMFMHADLWHLFSNMIFLWTFGRRLEDACGHWRYLLFYLFAGMVGNLGFALLHPAIEDLPGIGASGAISGVMGAYLLLFPGARIVNLWGLGSILRVPVALFRIVFLKHDVPVWRWTVTLPAWLLLIWYAIRNTIPSLAIITREVHVTGGVSYLAHLAGFLAGLTIFLFVRKDLLVRYISGRAL
jgi:membrane associated rhomboid family serine protease